MTATHIIVLLVTGIGVGFAGGLLGIGGGLIMGPVQYIVYSSMGVPTDIAIKLAFGTNLLVILPTAISGTWRHHRQGAVRWKVAIIMGSFNMIVAFGGATLATHLPGEVLKTAFGVIVMLAAVRMLFLNARQVEEEPRDSTWRLLAWSVPIGMVTGLLGVGGGIVAVPVMMLALKFKMRNAVATSLAMMILTSIGGVIGYIVNGLGVTDLPAYSWGYVNLLSWVLLAVTSVVMVQIGAMTAHRIPDKQLRYTFAVLMIYIGLKMLGVFDWLGWPI